MAVRLGLTNREQKNLNYLIKNHPLIGDAFRFFFKSRPKSKIPQLQTLRADQISGVWEAVKTKRKPPEGLRRAVVPLLARALRERDWLVRFYAAEALLATRHEDAKPVIRRALKLYSETFSDAGTLTRRMQNVSA